MQAFEVCPTLDAWGVCVKNGEDKDKERNSPPFFTTLPTNLQFLSHSSAFNTNHHVPDHAHGPPPTSKNPKTKPLRLTDRRRGVRRSDGGDRLSRSGGGRGSTGSKVQFCLFASVSVCCLSLFAPVAFSTNATRILDASHVIPQRRTPHRQQAHTRNNLATAS